ncbi:protein chibby homolog 1 [Tribolium castaneum]|uniref:protein chibby homolog 1 n=1 Tax=Tribolium castaneum TaxID=7070 RepID=UPI0030FF1FFC
MAMWPPQRTRNVTSCHDNAELFGSNFVSTMPLFGSKFAPKQPPLRKFANNVSEDLDELVSGQRSVQVRLGSQELVFENGDWIPESGESGTAHKSNQRLRKKIQELQEENNMLRLKYALMLNMLTQTTAEGHLLEKELEKWRNRK